MRRTFPAVPHRLLVPLLTLSPLLTLAACDPDAADPCAQPQAICTIAGTGDKAYNGDGLPALATALYWPMDLDFAPDGARPTCWTGRTTGSAGWAPTAACETVMGNDLVGDGPARPGAT